MGLIKKIFGSGAAGSARVSGSPPGASQGSSQFKESETAVDQARSRSGPRRELVQLVLRDVMRKHGIPSDWIDCRILSVMTRQHKSGVHVQFLVRQADDQLLPYVHAFQETFHQEIRKFDPQAGDWLFSVAWQFYGKATRGFAPTPDAAGWSDVPDPKQPDDAGQLTPLVVDLLGQPTQNAAQKTPPQLEEDHDLATDLEALQVLMSRPAELGELPPVAPRRQQGPGES